MARTVDKVPSSHESRADRFPYEAWFNGMIWELSYGEDDSDIPLGETSARAHLHYAANARGLNVKVNKRGSHIYVQAKPISD